MIIKIKNNHYEVNSILIDKKIYADDIKDIKKISLAQYPHIDIHIIKKKLDHVKKKLKLDFITLRLIESNDSINIEYRTLGSKILSANILFNLNYCKIISSTDEMLAIIFHEIGHLIDDIRLNKKVNNYNTFFYFVRNFLFSIILIFNSYSYLISTMNNKESITINVILILSLFINWIFHKIQISCIHKNNEFMSDYYGTKLLGNPITYINMLKLLHNEFGDQYSESHPELSKRILFIKQSFWLKIILIKFWNFFPFKKI